MDMIILIVHMLFMYIVGRGRKDEHQRDGRKREK